MDELWGIRQELLLWEPRYMFLSSHESNQQLRGAVCNHASKDFCILLFVIKLEYANPESCFTARLERTETIK